MRLNNRPYNTLRPINIQINTNNFAEGSCIISAGLTKIICTATVENKVPSFLKNSNSGWITAEYSMLPRATITRTDREAVKGKQAGRTLEIQRLIGRSLRSVVQLELLKDYQIKIDCDVISADSGTRTASITGAFVALYLAIHKMLKQNLITANPIKNFIAAISCGIINKQLLLDLDFSEDCIADVDANFVINEQNELIEIQATGEKQSFSHSELNKMLELANNGINELIAKQKEALKDYLM